MFGVLSSAGPIPDGAASSRAGSHSRQHLLLHSLGALDGSDGRYLLDERAWQQIDCTKGCPTLVDQLSALLALRNSLWTILFVKSAEQAPAAQLATVVSRFWRQARCTHTSARERLNTDCRRTLIVLSTAWGSKELDTAHGAYICSADGDGNVDGDANRGCNSRLRQLALLDAAGWIRHISRTYHAACRLCSSFSLAQKLSLFPVHTARSIRRLWLLPAVRQRRCALPSLSSKAH